MLDVSDHGGVRELRLDHPPVNALRADLLKELREAVEGAPAERVGGIVLSGAPGMFSAGLDVPYLLAGDADGAADCFEALFGVMHAIGMSRIPVAAALTGHSPAGGAVMAVFCDYRVMAEGEFTIGLNEVQVGLPVPAAILHAVTRLTGPRVAERLCVEGRLIDAAEALRVGLVDEAVPMEDVVPSAVAWCRRLMSLPRGAVAATRELARRDLHAALRETEETGVAAMGEVWNSSETRAAMAALVASLAEKKPSGAPS